MVPADELRLEWPVRFVLQSLHVDCYCSTVGMSDDEIDFFRMAQSDGHIESESE